MLQSFASGQCKTEWPADYSKCSKNIKYFVWQKDALLWATFLHSLQYSTLLLQSALVCIDWLSLIWTPKLTTRSFDVFLTVLPADWKQFKQKKSDSVLVLCIDTQNRSLQTSHSPIIPEQLSVKLMEFNWKYTAAPAKTPIQQLSQGNYQQHLENIPLNLNAVKMLPINMKKIIKCHAVTWHSLYSLYQ